MLLRFPHKLKHFSPSEKVFRLIHKKQAKDEINPRSSIAKPFPYLFISLSLLPCVELKL